LSKGSTTSSNFWPNWWRLIKSTFRMKHMNNPFRSWRHVSFWFIFCNDPFKGYQIQVTRGLKHHKDESDAYPIGWWYLTIQVVYANQSNNNMRAKYRLYEGECLVIWEVSSLFNVICMVAHSFKLQIISLWNFS